MFTRETLLVPVDGREQVLAVLRDALADAPAEQRPGLERALQLVEAVRHDDDTLKADYARRLLREAGVDPGTDEVRAVRVLRERIPGLGLAAAVDLAAHAKD
ncbi:hypothetical protein [Cellulomonas wangsupingiae]|uniref:Uncharacterized protein n=1 Tax=Cellulomonas wangsupingiae TaxID=2968085 RepID=A0ABY5KC63_9CELL|nr:hypothetical protein [Cellulomonas wangsupingiae]MCC2334318.1 hypothetical protein [Cellulomonas wangsupingiae]UUI65993.1 hypothetical protein NP075_04470 [Cellulomonas wangsupingiae]